jgi:hypothetical protein
MYDQNATCPFCQAEHVFFLFPALSRSPHSPVREDITLGCRACHKPFFACVDKDGERWHFLLAGNPDAAVIRAKFQSEQAQHKRDQAERERERERERESAWNNPDMIADDLKKLASATGKIVLGRLAEIGRKLRGG